MNQLPEIRRVMVLSPRHLPALLLAQMAARDDAVIGLSFDRVEYGYLIWVPSHETDWGDHPIELHPLYNMAMSRNCMWIKLDCDCEETKGLPVYDE